MQARGHDYLVVTSHDTLHAADEERLGGALVRRFPFRSTMLSGDPARLIALRRQVARLWTDFQPHLVHAFHVGPSALFYLQHAEARTAPLLVHLQGEILRGSVGGADSIMEKMLRAADWTTGVSGAVLRAAHALVPEIVERSSVLYSGAEPAPLVAGHSPHEQPRLLCLGRLVPDKGFDLALRAFATLADHFPTVRLVIAGDGPQRDELEGLAVALRIRERVDFLGWVPSERVHVVLDAASLVLMPSRREGLPLVAIQAAQMARPVIAARIGGLPEIVAHGETGLVVPPGDSAALAQAVRGLLEHPAEAARMGRAATRRSAELFGWERYLDEVGALYEAVIARASPQPAP
jgi:glycogen(starch) synthase